VRGTWADRYVRSAMRGTVAKTYEASWAAGRVKAVDAGEYALRRVRGRSIADRSFHTSINKLFFHFMKQSEKITIIHVHIYSHYWMDVTGVSSRFH
jgi:hypothetical protein